MINSTLVLQLLDELDDCFHNISLFVLRNIGDGNVCTFSRVTTLIFDGIGKLEILGGLYNFFHNYSLDISISINLNLLNGSFVLVLYQHIFF